MLGSTRISVHWKALQVGGYWSLHFSDKETEPWRDGPTHPVLLEMAKLGSEAGI